MTDQSTPVFEKEIFNPESPIGVDIITELNVFIIEVIKKHILKNLSESQVRLLTNTYLSLEDEEPKVLINHLLSSFNCWNFFKTQISGETTRFYFSEKEDKLITKSFFSEIEEINKSWEHDRIAKIKLIDNELYYIIEIDFY